MFIRFFVLFFSLQQRCLANVYSRLDSLISAMGFWNVCIRYPIVSLFILCLRFENGLKRIFIIKKHNDNDLQLFLKAAYCDRFLGRFCQVFERKAVRSYLERNALYDSNVWKLYEDVINQHLKRFKTIILCIRLHDFFHRYSSNILDIPWNASQCCIQVFCNIFYWEYYFKTFTNVCLGS